MWWVALAVAAAPTPQVELPALEAEAYFAGGPFAPARRLVARGAHAEAVRTLKQLLKKYPRAPERPQARYLLGLSMIRAGAYSEAAALFRQLRRSYPELRDDHTYYQGQALYLWGSYLDAAAVLDEVAPDGPWAEPARHLRAWALLKATDFRRLVDWLEGTADASLDDELWFVLAGGRVRIGDVVGAFRAYRRVWRTTRRAGLAGPALAAMAQLRVDERWLLSERAARWVRAEAGALQSKKRFGSALLRLERKVAADAKARTLRAEIAFARGRTAEAGERFRTAAQAYAQAIRYAPSGSRALRASIGLHRGRVLESLERGPESLAVYKRVFERYPDRPEAEQALFRAADLQLRARRYDEAKSACQQLLVSNPVSPFRRRCLWNTAWSEYRTGRFQSAQQFLATLVRGSLPSDLDAAARYWLGRTEAELGRGQQARRWWQQVIDRHPLGYYAGLAQRQLVEVPEPAAAPTVAAPVLPDALQKALEYTRLGLKGQALRAVTDYEAEVERTAERPTAQAFSALAQVYETFRRYRDARRVRERAAKAYAAGPGAEEFLAAARRAHPLKFEPQIRKAAKEFNLAPSLLFALIRTESGFKRDAISAMDAYGLAQLILPTARQVAARIKAGRVTRRRLLNDTRLNIRLGAAYLRSLLDRYKGSEPFAVAAYNAGPHAVDAWRRRRVRRLSSVQGPGVGVAPTADEFAEEIPVEETRRFIKAVLSRARAYAVLYPSKKPEAAPVDVPLPETAALVEPANIPEPVPPQYALPAGVHLWTEDALADVDAQSAWGWPIGLQR